MSPQSTRRLLALHRWCGVIVSLNLFVLALTGLILIFHEEIDHALGVVPEVTRSGQSIPLGAAIDRARASQPGSNAVFLFHDPDEHPGLAFVGLTKGSRKLDDSHAVAVDLRSGNVLEDFDPEGSFTGTVLKIHSELYAGPLGRLLVGLVAVAFIISLVSGALVYGPVMKRFVFGLIRRDIAVRTTIADLHKLIGAATLGWTLVVAITGLMLSLGSVLLQFYSMTELASLGAAYARAPIVEDLSSVDKAVRSAERAATGKRWSLVALPGSDLASPQHYTVLLQGSAGLESKVLTMALVDAKDGERAEVHELPFYLKAFLLSEPLHFGNYGGLTLKVIWAAFSCTTMALAGSGLFVFAKARLDRNARGRTEAVDAPSAAPG